MNYSRIFLLLFIALSLSTACSKKGASGDSSNNPVDATDYSGCLLSNINHAVKTGLPYYRSDMIFQYDSLKRITQTNAEGVFWAYNYTPGKTIIYQYLNSVTSANLIGRLVYTLDNNGRIATHYSPLNNMNDDFIYGQGRLENEYNTDGYLVGQKSYASGTTLNREAKFTYQNGNLTQRINTYYDAYINIGKIQGADTIDYTYDNTNWFPEAIYLNEITDVEGGKPNKNNVTSIKLKPYYPGGAADYYTSIQYTYFVKGKRLEKVALTGNSLKGLTNVKDTITFRYKCN